jgi:inorganic pyrophosphatase/exopolyphosphatase
MKWYFSNKLGIYVDLEPLKISPRVLNAAKANNIQLEWDDEGNICSIDYYDSKRLLSALDAKMLSVKEYWSLYEENNEELHQSLTSDYFAERLDRIYIGEKEFIDEPNLLSRLEYEKKNVVKADTPYGRPGWFYPENNINHVTYEPIKLEHEMIKKERMWKYWSPDLNCLDIRIANPIRGFVTSVGMPSFDLGIPIYSKEKKLFVREIRRTPLSLDLSSETYNRLKTAAENRDFKTGISLMKSPTWNDIKNSIDVNVHIFMEQIIDVVGEYKINNKEYEGLNKLRYNDFLDYLKSCKNLIKNDDVFFVVGHPNPDTDTVISCIFEAYRKHLETGETYIPVVQSEEMPAEIKKLLGELNDYIIFRNNPFYINKLESGLARFNFVDQNYQSEIQKYVLSIIDHHIEYETVKFLNAPKTIEPVGATASLITRKYIGCGYTFDEKLSYILLGAILMDTENLAPHKATNIDNELVRYLNESVNTDIDNLYKYLMKELLSQTNLENLINRDYKEYYDIYGFSVLKIMSDVKLNAKKLTSAIKKKIKQKNLVCIVVKIVYYKNFVPIKEKIIFIKNNYIPHEIVEKLKSFIEEITKDRAGKITKTKNSITCYKLPQQISRKKIVPYLDIIMTAYNKCFYSKSIKKWVSREFAKDGWNSYDKEGRVNYITYYEALKLAEKNNAEMLKPQEYWKVLKDAEGANDIQIIKSLKAKDFIEFLNTTNREYVKYVEGKPGLILEKEINLNTGLPSIVHSPNEFSNPLLWRYWSFPKDGNEYALIRSHIFLLDRPCLDGKVKTNERFPNLGVRLIYSNVALPEIEFRHTKIIANGKEIKIKDDLFEVTK